MNFDKESKSRKKKKFRGWGGGGGGLEGGMGGMNMRAAIFFIHDTLSQPLLLNRSDS